MVRGIANSKIGFGDLILLLRYFFKLKVSTHPNVTKVLMHFKAEDESMLSILTEHQFFPMVMKHNKYDYFRIMSQQASLSAVRWALTWLSARYLVIRDHIRI